MANTIAGITVTEVFPTPFQCKNPEVAYRFSRVVTPTFMWYDNRDKVIHLTCSDGYTRKCMTTRMDHSDARSLWSSLVQAGKNKENIQLIAAGGNDPTKWFFDFRTVEA